MRLEAIASAGRLEAIAIRLEAIAIRLEAYWSHHAEQAWKQQCSHHVASGSK